MHQFVYVLRSDHDGEFYTGYTNNLDRRVDLHLRGKVFSTRHRLPVRLIYFEVCGNENDARARERYLKSGMGKRYLRNRLKFFLQSEKL